MHLQGPTVLSWEPRGAAPRGSRRLSPEQVAWVLGNLGILGWGPITLVSASIFTSSPLILYLFSMSVSSSFASSFFGCARSSLLCAGFL